MQQKTINVDIFDEKGVTMIKTLEEIIFKLKSKEITIPKGFISDGQSCPRFLWRLLDPPITAETLIPSIIHDFLYRYQICTRLQADKLYDELLQKNGYSAWKRYLVYHGLRWFGGKAWDEHKQRLEAELK